MFGEKQREAFMPQNTVSTIQGGVIIILCGCFTECGTGNLVKVEGNVNIETYMQYNILKENLEWSAVKLCLNHCFLFQYDNDPKQTSPWVKNHRKKTKVNVIKWPAQRKWARIPQKKCEGLVENYMTAGSCTAKMIRNSLSWEQQIFHLCLKNKIT